MKGRYILGFVLFSVIIASAFADEGALQITGSFVQDYIQPGDEVLLNLNFENLGSPKATTLQTNILINRLVYTVILPEGVSFVNTVDSETKSIGYINPTANVNQYIPLKISENLEYGDYIISVFARYKIIGEDSNVTAEFLLPVKSKPNFDVISDYTLIDIGEEFDYTAKIVNSGNQVLKNVLVTADASSSIVIKRPKVVVDEILPGETAEVSFPIFAGIDTTPGLTELTLTVDYNDKYGESYSVEYPVGIIFGGDTDFLVQVEETNPNVLKRDTVGEVTLNIANIGFLEAGSVEVTIQPNDKIIANTKTSAYLSNLNRGDYTSSTFELIPKEEGVLDLSVVISYTNTYGERASETKSFKLNVGNTGFEKITASATAVDNTAATLNTIGFVFMFGAGAFILYYYIKNKKRKQK
jgi:hypothetical protein